MIKKNSIIYCIFFMLILLQSCAAPRAALKANFDFSGINLISVGKFTPSTGQPNSGAVIENEFMRQLLIKGYVVKTDDSSITDVILQGSVTEYQPNRRYLIQAGMDSTDSQQVVVYQPPVELSGSSTYNLGSVFGLGDSARIVVSNATVGITAYMKDVKTGDIIWSNSYTYEGLDLNSALGGAVQYLLRSLPGK